MNPKTILLAVLLLSFALAAGAQTYGIDWHAVPGGGGASSNGQYSLTGSIGQTGAGSVASGGNYSLTGGFWSLVSVVQTVGAPVLTVTHSVNQVIISWPTPTTGWTLQQNASVAATGWVPSGFSVSATNGISSITIAAPVGNLFFRLSQP